MIFVTPHEPTCINPHPPCNCKIPTNNISINYQSHFDKKDNVIALLQQCWSMAKASATQGSNMAATSTPIGTLSSAKQLPDSDDMAPSLQ